MKTGLFQLPHRPVSEHQRTIEGVPQVDVEEEMQKIRKDIKERLTNLQELIIED